MGFFKPADDRAAETAAEAGDEGEGSDDESMLSSSEGEGGDALEDLGVDLDAGQAFDDGSAAGL